ncbi:MAG TPA: winged helix-turn-helix domain-containing protein [Thermoleophilaceae bacterium]|nr:winged helix-turn-helix domain-containing protein [Thermoleophilaceae bacterium]
MAAPSNWNFLTNHGLALLCIAEDPGIRLRDIADRLGITERAAHRIVARLIDSGYVTRKRVGRRNSYEVRTDMPVRTLERDVQLSELLSVVAIDPVGC